MSTARTTTRQLQPATAAELLDQEEALAIQNVADSALRLGDDLSAAADLRGRIRRHPFLAIGLGAVAGFVGGPLLLRASKRLLSSASGVALAASARPQALSGFLRTSLRAVRARR